MKNGFFSYHMEYINSQKKKTNPKPKKSEKRKKMNPKPKKSEKQKGKEKRAKKHGPLRFHRHEMIPVWAEVYDFPQSDSCEPVDWQDVYDETDWQPCKTCHWCRGEQLWWYPSGTYELEFHPVKFY